MKKNIPTQPLKITLPKHRRWPKILLIIVVLGVIGGGIWWYIQKSANPEQAPEEVVVLAPTINGNMVPEADANKRPLAVVIENSPDARPQSGLEDTELVYEMVAEGGITRFLAIFQSREPKSIGPVRSARPYYNFLANIWGAAMVHSGGSTQALSELSSGVHRNLYDINEFFFGKYFNRDSTRSAPHNLYTTPQNLREVLEDKEETDWDTRTLADFENTPTDQLVAEITNITIPFSLGAFTARYEYDGSTNSYKRFISGEPHLDRNSGQQLSAKNVLIQLTDVTPNGDELLTVSIRLTGSGPCYLFASGKFQECRWSYENGRHVYRDLEGNPLKLQSGPTWIGVFPRDRQSQITWN
ncbi:MAG TPA: DUF3048 domain-containing protein [Candidatus Doudnabacteria bacterium]|nr:DUF3048 domain-containing protein [Candidatus Doudnabacteria bacterium]